MRFPHPLRFYAMNSPPYLHASKCHDNNSTLSVRDGLCSVPLLKVVGWFTLARVTKGIGVKSLCVSSPARALCV